ncbi:pyridoxamine 5'-phosphate oxidase family protein [Natronocalculus amylovorans]|uniref:Pyridoxamine 5'-phosphate oxidase family protein n=1 Tax=Natronocalculus amylovorans TaxID=2917812 RepID=A0AAE3FVI5_9EURY|nr:pyridoxamine 5'-phosphate oxidase family protein [Natronocalculus amylovorans]MCL9816332.1 pyridoxamine 5'-phosphate oxidase family protein [Natronocalculus amylovorans]
MTFELSDFPYTYTIGMTDRERDEKLSAESVGVLGLAAENTAYCVPVGYHYGDDRLIIRLLFGPQSKKRGYLDKTETAMFVVYGHEGPRDSWSIIVRGSLTRIPDSTFSIAECRSMFGPVRLFGENVDEATVELYELQPTSIVGRRT